MSSRGMLVLAAIVLSTPLHVFAQTIDRLSALRTGQWEVRHEKQLPVVPGASEWVVSSQVCIDPATAREVMEHALALVTQCPSEGFKRAGDDWVILNCEILGGVRMKATISGDFKSAIVLRVETTVDGRLTAIDTKTALWKGPACANAMVPGDVAHELPGVPKFNVRNDEEVLRALEAISAHGKKKHDDWEKRRPSN
jgi:hypothetical protein